MQFAEAMAAYSEGKPVRVKSWSPGYHIVLGKPCGYLDTEAVVNVEWEEYDDRVEIHTLQPGDLFELGEYEYRLLPAYMIEYVMKVRDVPLKPVLPCIAHSYSTPDLCYIPSNTKVKKING